MFKRKKIKALLCILLALSVVFAPSVNIAAQGLIFDNQGIYEEQSTNVKLRFMIGIFYDGKPLDGGKMSIIWDFKVINKLLGIDKFPELDITVLGEYGEMYYKVRCDGKVGYIPKIFIGSNIQYKYIELDKRYIVVYQNSNKTVKISDKNVSGTADWKSSDTGIAEITKNGEKCTINGKKTGVATVTASMGGATEKCYVCVVDKWLYGWKTTLKAEAKLYNYPSDPKETVKTLSQGTTVTVYGDCQSANKYCYVKYNDGSKTYWGFVHIKHLSNRGTYYNDYKDFKWTYPVNKKYIMLSSYYGQRSGAAPYEHKGIDITGDKPKEIAGTAVKAVCDAEVTQIDNENGSDAGNYVALTSLDCQDPKSGKSIIIIYMHLRKDIKVSEKQIVKAGDTIGYVSNSNGKAETNDKNYTDSEMGVHLHFEVTTHGTVWNNRSFGNSVNPLWFYPDIKFKTDQVSSWYGMYWSNNTTDTKVNIS